MTRRLRESHYWQITEVDWERAASEPTDATRVAKAVQKAVHTGSKSGASGKGEAV